MEILPRTGDHGDDDLPVLHLVSISPHSVVANSPAARKQADDSGNTKSRIHAKPVFEALVGLRVIGSSPPLHPDIL